MTTLFPVNTLLPCTISKPQLPFPSLRTQQPSKNFTCSCFTPATHHHSTLQTPKPIAAHSSTFSTGDWPELLKLFIGSRHFLLAQAVHAYLTKLGCQHGTFEGNNLINLYLKFDRLHLAQKVFDEMPVRNQVTWTSLIKGYLEDNDFQSVYRMVDDMHNSGEMFNEHTCTVILQACSSTEDLILGEQVHGFVIKSGFDDNVFVSTSLISMYTKCGSFDGAEKVFDYTAFKDVRCLNFMILEYGRAGNGQKAIEVFITLLNDGFEPTDYTFTNVISACSGNLGVEESKQLHGLAFKYGVLTEPSVGNAIINMYVNNGMTKEAERMFSSMSERNLISWTALISGYTRSGDGGKAVDAFLELHDKLGVDVDSTFLTVILDGCSESKNLEMGVQIHGFLIKLGYTCDVNIATALIDIYATCGNLQSAKIVFNGLTSNCIASFNAILAGFMESNDDGEDPLFLFNQMRLAGIKPDSVTFSRFLSLSANQASFERGRSFHGYAIKTGLEADISLANAVITMYAKCGCIEDSYQMFGVMNDHDSVSWNAMISAYAFHGQGQKALLLFDEMKKKGFDPDGFTMLAVMQACAYCGLWKDGISIFKGMEPKYGIKPQLEHYACAVDLFGRADQFSEAMDVINESPFPNSTLLWRTLVNVCKLRGDLKFGKLASTRLLDLSPDEAGSYILVSNMYGSGKMLDEAAKVRTIMNDLKISKEAGSSWIEIDNKFHNFVANGKDHSESSKIYTLLNFLTSEMKRSGLHFIAKSN